MPTDRDVLNADELSSLCDPDFGDVYQREIDEIYPKWKDVTCRFCGAHLRLIRRGRLLANGEARYWYVEKGYADDWQNHPCKDIDTFQPKPKVERAKKKPAGTLFDLR